jgi:hypothetical protein
MCAEKIRCDSKNIGYITHQTQPRKTEARIEKRALNDSSENE